MCGCGNHDLCLSARHVAFLQYIISTQIFAPETPLSPPMPRIIKTLGHNYEASHSRAPLAVGVVRSEPVIPWMNVCPTQAKLLVSDCWAKKEKVVCKRCYPSPRGPPALPLKTMYKIKTLTIYVLALSLLLAAAASFLARLRSSRVASMIHVVTNED